MKAEKLCPVFKTVCRKDKCEGYYTSKNKASYYYDTETKLYKTPSNPEGTAPSGTVDRHLCLKVETTTHRCRHLNKTLSTEKNEVPWNEVRKTNIFYPGAGIDNFERSMCEFPIEDYHKKEEAAE